MLRAAVHTVGPAMPRWPRRTAPTEEWRAWLSAVWTDSDFRRTVSQASPHLADQVQAIIDGRTPKVRRMRRPALSTARYAIRYARRSTPYGLFARSLRSRADRRARSVRATTIRWPAPAGSSTTPH